MEDSYCYLRIALPDIPKSRPKPPIRLLVDVDEVAAVDDGVLRVNGVDVRAIDVPDIPNPPNDNDDELLPLLDFAAAADGWSGRTAMALAVAVVAAVDEVEFSLLKASIMDLNISKSSKLDNKSIISPGISSLRSSIIVKNSVISK